MADTEDFAISSLPIDVNEIAVPEKLLALAPWHRPRKQFVREKQWRDYISKLIEKDIVKRQANNTIGGEINFNYLTLAGVDYFDVEVISNVCAYRKVKLTTTNFLSTNKASLMARATLRQESLIKSDKITDRSATYSQRLEDICVPGGQAFRDVQRRGPYHAVNVDACGSITKGKRGYRIIDAIHKIVDLQIKHSTGDWLLFLTADARPDNVDDDVLNALCDAIRQNAKESDEFRVGTLEMFGKSEVDDLESVLQEICQNDDSFVRLFVLGLSKWLLHNGQSVSWDVEALDSYCYSTRGGKDGEIVAPSMPSLAFKFTRRLPSIVDPYQVVETPVTEEEHVKDYSILALRSSAQMPDLDKLLAENSELRGKLATTTYNLLKRAGYEESALEEYVSEYAASPCVA